MFNIAVVGCGSISGVWLNYIKTRDDTNICALVDTNDTQAVNVKQKYNLQAEIYKDLEEIWKTETPDIVLDLTPPEFHFKTVTTALNHGCHVFGEKPMAMSVEEAEEMVVCAKKAGKVYAVMQNYRYNKDARSIKKAISENQIGDIWHANANFFLGPHFGGFRDIMDSPLLVDMSIHTFDKARFFIGSRPVSVTCHEYNPKSSWYKGNACAVCIFEFESGAVFVYNGSWCSEGHMTSWNSDWRISGTEGTILWDGNNPPIAEKCIESNGFFKDKVKVSIEEVKMPYEHSHAACLDEMFSALKENRKPETHCDDNIMSIKMVFGALESVKTNKKVFI